MPHPTCRPPGQRAITSMRVFKNYIRETTCSFADFANVNETNLTAPSRMKQLLPHLQQGPQW